MGMMLGKITVEEPAFEVLLKRTSVAVPYEIRKYGKRFAVETEYVEGEDNGTPFRALAKYIGVFGDAENVKQPNIAMTAPVVMQEQAQNATAPTVQGSEKIAMTAPVVMTNKNGDTGSGPEKIAMTAPVVMTNNNKATDSGSTMDEKKKKIMQFMLPKEYNEMSKIPKPMNPNVRIKEVPSAYGAVHVFSGFFNDQITSVKAIELSKQLNLDLADGKSNSGSVELKEDDVLSNYQFWGYNPPFTIPMLRRNEIWIELTQKQVNLLNEKHSNS